MRPDPADWTLGVTVHLVYGEKGRSRGRLEYSPIIAIAARVADRRPDRAPNAKFGRNLRISLKTARRKAHVSSRTGSGGSLCQTDPCEPED